jgi:hypothetical protein
VVVGGIAAVLHGSPRNTFDLDIVFATDTGNLAALGDVLVSLRATLAGIEEDAPFVPDGRTLAKMDVLTLMTDAGKLAVLRAPSGAPPYHELRRNAARWDVGGIYVLVAGIDDLLAMKQAAGRPKDLADIAELQAIKRLRDTQPV